MRLLIAWVSLSMVTAPAAAAQRVLFARGQWATLQSQDGRHCQAAARSLRDASKGAEQARASFEFDAGGPRRGEFHVRLSRAARQGSSVITASVAAPRERVPT